MFLHNLDGRHLEHKVKTDIVAECDSKICCENPQIRFQGGRAREFTKQVYFSESENKNSQSQILAAV